LLIILLLLLPFFPPIDGESLLGLVMTMLLDLFEFFAAGLKVVGLTFSNIVMVGKVSDGVVDGLESTVATGFAFLVDTLTSNGGPDVVVVQNMFKNTCSKSSAEFKP
jgi:hypothetical protein